MNDLKHTIGLTRKLAFRQVQVRYQESVLGLAWAVASPLILALIYTVVYSTVFKAKWFIGPGIEENFALVLYSGLVLYLLVAEVLNSSVTVIENNAVLIKRTTMPTIIVPLAAATSALITFAFSLVPLALLFVILKGIPPAAALLFPIVAAIAWILTVGMGLVIASISPYFRDMRQFMPLLTMSLLFLSPIFYQASALPDGLRQALYVVNPLMVLIPSAQDLFFLGKIPPVLPLLAWLMIGLATVAIGRRIFKKASAGFADVV